MPHLRFIPANTALSPIRFRRIVTVLVLLAPLTGCRSGLPQPQVYNLLRPSADPTRLMRPANPGPTAARPTVRAADRTRPALVLSAEDHYATRLETLRGHVNELHQTDAPASRIYLKLYTYLLARYTNRHREPFPLSPEGIAQLTALDREVLQHYKKALLTRNLSLQPLTQAPTGAGQRTGSGGQSTPVQRAITPRSGPQKLNTVRTTG